MMPSSSTLFMGPANLAPDFVILVCPVQRNAVFPAGPFSRMSVMGRFTISEFVELYFILLFGHGDIQYIFLKRVQCLNIIGAQSILVGKRVAKYVK